MTTKNNSETAADKKTAKTNKFEQEQPLRHPLADVVQDGNNLKINNQFYSIIVNERDALDLDTLRKKYDPYLDQYDFLVGDVSSEHLRLKGFYDDEARTSIDRKQMSIADYLTEYCNPGSPYFILQLNHPLHHYKHQRKKREEFFLTNKHRSYRRRNDHFNNQFKKRRLHQTKFRKKTIAVKKEHGRRHSFVIKKRKG